MAEQYVELFVNLAQEGLGIQRPGWMVEKVTQTLAVDFDGVIHRYSRGWQDGTIYDGPMPGAIEGLRRLQERYAVYVFTSREPLMTAIWLGQWFLTAVDPEYAIVGSEEAKGERAVFWNRQDQILVTNRKLPAVAYIDDRGFQFTTWDDLIDKMASPWPWPWVGET